MGVEDPRRVLARHGLHAKKSWGQNFLHDHSVHARIVAAAAAGPDDTVIEIGAGLGTLTAALAGAEPAPARVIAVERDADMLRVLAAELGGDSRVTVMAEDATRLDFAAARREAGRPVIVVGNLPYQISSALLLAIVSAGPAIARAVVMVQRELAERVVAPPGGRTYGRLSVAVQQHAAARVLFHVRPGSFHPIPSVTSSVMRLDLRATPQAPVRDAALFEEVVKQAFGTRRKMLRRALEPAFGAATVARALEASGIDGTLRAERLSVAEFARLTDAVDDARRAPDAPDASGALS